MFPRLGIATLSVLAVMLGTGAPVSAASTVTVSSFESCALHLQGNSPHMLTLREAQACGPGLPVISATAVPGMSTLPGLFILSRANGYALEWTTQSTVQAANPAVAGSCYNSWSYPNPGFWDAFDFGNMYAAGYGNHCNYANIPSGPSVSNSCVTSCNSIQQTHGHADSNWDRNNYGINSALAWENVSFYGYWGIDSWSCRAWVDTNGNQNPSKYCV
jgi:hypothetical protein